MRYTARFDQQSIPQWRACYLNYEYLKLVVKTIRDTVRERQQLWDLMYHGTNLQARTQKSLAISSAQEISTDKIQVIKVKYNYFFQASEKANSQFCQIYSKNIELYLQFVQYKHKEIEGNYKICWKIHFIMDQEEDGKMWKKFIPYVEFLFVQAFYLTRMVQSNVQAERRILAKHKLYANDTFPTPQPQIQQCLAIDACHRLRRQIQRFYFRISKQPKQKNRYKLRKLAEQGHIEPKETLFIGLLIGTVITVIVFISIILARSSVTLNTNTVFNKDFILWRGISIFIFYIWILGVDFGYFQKYKISHRIIFRNNYPKYPASTDLFKIAGIFSIIFIVVFTIYSLQIAGILEIGTIAPQWLPLFVWGPFLLFLVNPLPVLYHYGRRFFWKMIFNAFTSVIFVVDFPKIWVTAQAISLLNVFQDLFYAFCFYTHLDFPYDPTVNVCRAPAIQAKFIYTVVIYSIRIIQCLKVGFGQGSYWKKSQFLNSIKFSLSLLTAILAYVWKQVPNPNVFPAWLTFAIISTLFSFLWDSVIGWDLFHRKSKNWMLRDQLIYPKRNYYVWLVINFFLRSAWTLNISPNIIREFLGTPEIFNLAFGFLEIFRRGIWNFLRVQVEQIRNNSLLQALSKQKQKNQKTLYNFLKQNKNRIQPQSATQLVQKQKQMLEVQENENEDLAKNKEKILSGIKQFKQLWQSQKEETVKKQEEIDKTIKYLLKNVY